ncbi:MAG: hypothetical protein ACK4MS_07665 [Paracoccaceae bacterium]
MARSRNTDALINEARATEDALRASMNRLKGRWSGRSDRDADLLGLATGAVGQTVVATAAARALRSYPLATVLVGAGLAWLAFGTKREDRLTDQVADTLDDWQAKADDAREAARDKLAALYDDVAETGAEAAEFAREKATVTADLAADLAAAFAHGLSDLSRDAAERIIAARERAYAALASGGDALRDELDDLRTAPDDRNFIVRHPMASAAVAVALGAALATALQANRRDGETLTESAEALMAKARNTMERESKAAGQAMGKAADALRSRGAEAARAMVSDLTDILANVRDTGRNMGRDAMDTVDTSARKSARQVASKIKAAEKRATPNVRARRRATQKLAEKLAGGPAN